jgi:uncharacterized tellurite resistance protein B-like protein
MGSWDELDARGQPSDLTPAIAFIVSMTHIAGADHVYLEEEEGSLAAFLPRHGLADMDYEQLIDRADVYLKNASLGQFLNEAPLILNEEQRLCILINMFDAALADGHFAPQEEALFNQFRQAFRISGDHIAPYLEAIRIKHNLSVFTR